MNTKNLIKTSVQGGIVVLCVAGSLYAWWHLQSADPLEASSGDRESTAGSEEPAETVVILQGDKLAAASIKSEPVQRGTVPLIHTVPGRVQYNDVRHAEIKTPADGVLVDVLVMPGDRVQPGDVLAWLNCEQVGTARADVLKREEELALSKKTLTWKQTLRANVLEAVDALKQRQDFEELRGAFADRPLGDYRNQLFAAYSRHVLADATVASAQRLGKSGVLSGNTVRQRTSEQRSSEAVLQATCEQAAFDVAQDHSRAELDVRDAQRRLQVAQEHLASLLMGPGVNAPDDALSPADLLSANDGKQLSRVAVRAPFAGTIEQRVFSASERVRIADSLFVLADTSTLWIEAEIRESDWKALQLRPGQKLTVTTPALPNGTLEAQVRYVGREVSTETNAIPLVARIENPDGQLRPGLFVRVSVPVGETPNVLTVADSAVVRHEGQTFVFVEEREGMFRRTDVAAGTSGAGRVEIKRGLDEGQRVVTHGASTLKAELLLEGEED